LCDSNRWIGLVNSRGRLLTAKNAEGVTLWGSYTGRLDDSTSAYRLVAVDRAGHTAAAEVGDCYIVVMTGCIGSSMDQSPAAIGFPADNEDVTIV